MSRVFKYLTIMFMAAAVILLAMYPFDTYQRGKTEKLRAEAKRHQSERIPFNWDFVSANLSPYDNGPDSFFEHSDTSRFRVVLLMNTGMCTQCMAEVHIGAKYYNAGEVNVMAYVLSKQSQEK